MKKSLLKTAAIVVAGAGAITVCFFGYRVNAGRQYEQRVSYAETAMKKEETSLKEIKKEIQALYQDKDQVFLRSGLKEDEVTKVGNKLDAIKLSADEFGISDKDLPENVAAVKTEKEKLNEQLADVETKYNIQSSVNKLFTKAVSNWHTAKNDVIIKDTLKDTDVGEIRERLNLMDDSQWKDVIIDYLEFASAQIKRATDIQKSIDKMLKDDKVTEEATYEAYLNLVNSIAQVRNEDLKEKFEKAADKISRQIGVAADPYTSVDPATGYEETSEVSETDTQTDDGTQVQDDGTQVEEDTGQQDSGVAEDGSYY
ncbi:hypothetical protein [Enterococcus mediterraneensis]|uniref:hypothetical protein n=1 Tax=Enterococcus mediterraneensis TaxID=2364791 RepID=UPI0019D26ED7|nr:hypothetical protein [Enterococcus mediterraneensis]